MSKISLLFANTSLILSLIFMSQSANAAPVAINNLSVDNASATLFVGGQGPFSASSPISPPAEIIMGEYQDSIMSISSTDFSLNIYSTDLYGAPAPSGYVDGTAINVDFSSLRGDLNYDGKNYDFELWPLTTTLDYGTYDSGTNAFDIGWTDNFTLNIIDPINTPITLEVSLQGDLTAVPLPAALWLFASGCIAMFGFVSSQRKNTKFKIYT